jgi:serine/threonine-protein kinase
MNDPDSSPIERAAIKDQLERVLRSATFRRAERSAALLRYLVERAVEGDVDRLKEYTVGREALGRGGAFDPRTDPIVRAEASRLRDRLSRYYETDGRDDLVVIQLPRGSYMPRFERKRVLPEVAAREPEAAAARAPAIQPFVWATVGAVLLGGGLATVAWMRATRDGAKTPLQQFEVELNVDGTLGSDVGPDVVLSRDGNRLLFVARDSAGRSHLYMHRLDQAAPSILPGTEGARVPFLSPDGRHVGFWSDGKVKRLPVEGGSPVVLCDAADLLGASWGEDGSIVAALNPTGKLWRIPEMGGQPEVLLDLTADSASPVWPQLLPGGKAVLYTALSRSGADQAHVEAYQLGTGRRRILVRGATFGRYIPNGYLTYVNQGTLYAVRFNAGRLAVRGAALPVLEHVAYSRTFGYAHVDVAHSGMLVFRNDFGSGQFAVARLDRAGNTEPLFTAPGSYQWLRAAPDGQRLAFTNVESGIAAVWIADVRTQERRRVAGATTEYSGLTWLPDGRRLVVGGRGGLGWIDTDGTQQPRPLTSSALLQVPWSYAPQPSRLAYYEMQPSTGFDLWTVPVTISAAGLTLGTPEPFLQTPAFEVYPAFSPDGHWIAYSSNTSGRYEIYVRRYPDDGAAVRVSSYGGRVAAWARNANELLYSTYDQRIMSVVVRVERDRFSASSPQPWTSATLADAGVLPNFDLAPDGNHLIALVPAAPTRQLQSRNHVTVLLNFLDEVRRRTEHDR